MYTLVLFYFYFIFIYLFFFFLADKVVIRAVYTRENKPRLTLAAAYVSRKHPV